jgi:hypothetical protein
LEAEFLEIWRGEGEEIYGDAGIIGGNFGVLDVEVDRRFRRLAEGEGFFGALPGFGEGDSSSDSGSGSGSEEDSESGEE